MWRCGRRRGRGRLWRLRFEGGDGDKCLGILRGGGGAVLYRWRVRPAKAQRLHTSGWVASSREACLGRAKARPSKSHGTWREFASTERFTLPHCPAPKYSLTLARVSQ
jgi:hypothetical protein